ncbi:MAG: Glu-tRNA(Gln) amidotransferase subunit GatD [Candidatus Woesearchaeota archaeon]|nr:MAG: Glu-tRNA(Gln) amidotransferase subunit GatD [Candidatus Woesearchaeota archaeon]
MKESKKQSQSKAAYTKMHKNEVTVQLTDKQSVEGKLITENETTITLKLSSGYNQLLLKKRIKSITQKNKTTTGKKATEEKKKQTTKKKEQGWNDAIVILNVGGTIACKIDYATGAVVAQTEPDELTSTIPELQDYAPIATKSLSNMQSDDIRLQDINAIVKAIEECVNKGARGVIVTHGTDFLHYSASGVSFALEHPPIPVIFVGSQRSSDRPSSDAAINVINAAYTIRNSSFTGVALCMHKNADDGTNTLFNPQQCMKLHTSRRDAFKQINAAPLGEVNAEQNHLVLFHNVMNETKPFKAYHYNENLRIGLVKAHPHMFVEEFLHLNKFDAAIFEASGLGHFPISIHKENEKIRAALAKLSCKKVLTAQTIWGRINLNVYSPQRILKEMGFLGHNLNVPTHAAFMKIAFLLSNFPEDVDELYEINLRGELTERTENVTD